MKKIIALLLETTVIVSIVIALFQPIHISLKILIIFFFFAIFKISKCVIKDSKKTKKTEYKPKFSSIEKDIDNIKDLASKYSNNNSTDDDFYEWKDTIDKLKIKTTMPQNQYIKNNNDLIHFHAYSNMIHFAEEIFELYLQKHYPEQIKLQITNKDYLLDRYVIYDEEHCTSFVISNYEDIQNKKYSKNFSNYATELLLKYKNNYNIRFNNVKLVLCTENALSLPIKESEHEIYVL